MTRGIYKQPLHKVRNITDLRDMTRGSIELFKNKNAFLIKDKKGEPYIPVTYEQYGHDLDSFGSKLYELGVQNGERVAIVAETRYEWYISYLSTVNGKGVIVPIDKELPAEEIKSMLDRAEVSVVIYSSQLQDKVFSAIKEVATVKTLVLMDYYKNENEPFTHREATAELPEIYSFRYLLEEGKKLLEQGYTDYIDCDIDIHEMRILLFTSGTTARSKAVMHSHHTIATNLLGMTQMIDVHDDVCLSVLPLHHTYECTCGFLCQIYRGDTVAECEGLRQIPANLAESKTTLLLAVPLILESFHKRIWRTIDKQGKRKKVEFALKLTRALRKIGIDIRRKVFKDIIDGLGGHLRLVIVGGAAIDPKVLEDFNDFGILAIQGYGLTECGPILAVNRDIDFRHYSAGMPLPETEAEVVDPDENGIGEFRSRGENVMLGYYGDPELTAETIRDGWFYTGDYGYIDKDSFMIITGRKKNVIVTKNGKNVFPEEIEAILNRNPEIAESIVSGEDGRNGDLEIAVEIYPDDEAVRERLGRKDYSNEEVQALLEDLVKEFNRDQPIYKKIHKVRLRDQPFVKNTSKKIIRQYK